MADEVPKPTATEVAVTAPATKLGLLGRFLERTLGPGLDNPGSRRRDYTRADAGFRSVLILGGILPVLVTLIVWLVHNQDIQNEKARQAYEKLVDKMIDETKESARLQREAISTSISTMRTDMRDAIQDNTKATKEYTEAVQKVKR